MPSYTTGAPINKTEEMDDNYLRDFENFSVLKIFLSRKKLDTLSQAQKARLLYLLVEEGEATMSNSEIVRGWLDEMPKEWHLKIPWLVVFPLIFMVIARQRNVLIKFRDDNPECSI